MANMAGKGGCHNHLSLSGELSKSSILIIPNLKIKYSFVQLLWIISCKQIEINQRYIFIIVNVEGLASDHSRTSANGHLFQATSPL